MYICGYVAYDGSCTAPRMSPKDLEGKNSMKWLITDQAGIFFSL